jgi:spore germination cell wall hydrolase CwlJ-like protein
MTAELGEWLAELGQSEPATAAEVGAAVVAVLDAAEPSGLAIVGSPSTPLSADPREAADYTNGLMLEELQHVRRRVSDVATSRKRGELRLGKERAAGTGRARLAELESDLVAARQREEHLTEQSQRLQWQVDAYRTAKESAKGMYTAAAERPTPPPQPPSAADPAPGLLELRAGAAGSDIRILFAVEPADTVTLLAVLEGPEAISEHGAEAVELASSLLTEIREDGWPADVDEVILEDSAAFQARFVTATS